MKKFLLLSTFLLSSCNKIKIPFYLDDEFYNSSQLIELTSIEEFNELEKNKRSFGIYLYLPGCLTCSSFKPYLEEFIEKNNITLYSISYSKIKNSNNTLIKKIDYAPSVALFSNGKIITFLDSINDDHIEYFKSTDNFSSWFEEYVYLK